MKSLSFLRPPLTGRHVLAALVGFFLVVFAVNGVFLYVSLNSHPGVISDDAYREGLNYNRDLENADRQAGLGWKKTVSAADGLIGVRFADRDGAPLTGLSISATVRRPVHDRADRTLAFREIGGGVYQMTGAPLGVGRWSVKILATYPGSPPYRIETSIQVDG